MSGAPPESLLLQVYVHCSVVLSDQGVTADSKACSYDAAEERYVLDFQDLNQTSCVLSHFVLFTRWKEVSGASEVCDCCSAKCKSPSKFPKGNLSNDPQVALAKVLIPLSCHFRCQDYQCWSLCHY